MRSVLVFSLGMVAASSLAVGGSSALAAEPVRILPLGDSITYGTDDFTDFGGYRGPLQELMVDRGLNVGDDFDFIGARNKGVGSLDSGEPLDNDHWGRRGAIAADEPSSNQFIGSSDGGPVLKNDIDDNADSVFAGGPADVVLLHIGTNTLLGDTETQQPSFTSDYSVTEAAGQLGNLLQSLQNAHQNGYIADDADIVISDIIPKARSIDDPSVSDAQLVVNTHRYNQRIDDQIATLDSTFQSLIRRTNMFEISYDNALIKDMLAMGNVGSSLNQQLDPDGDGRVDWITGESDPFDESNPTLADYGGANINILTQFDRIHPTPLGYQVMASEWMSTLEAIGAVPEPTSVFMLVTGLGLLLSPRGRGRHT
jgi:hypothetical protein